jgi:carboxypeptidase C (cathepsin A)
VARVVQREQGIVISGIVMVSPMLESGLQFGPSGYALGAALALPSLVATELDRTNAFSQAALTAAEHFAMTEYLTTLAGAPPSGDAAYRFYARIASMTGLPVSVVTQARGSVRNAFVKHLQQGKIVSRYDATQSFTDPYPESEGEHGPDPVLEGPVRALGGLFVGYARDELNYKTEITYNLLADLSGRWDWGSRRSQPGVSDDLRVLLAFDPSFRLLVIHGRNDMITPYSVTRYILDHLPSEAAARTRLAVYRGGHMLYFDDASRKAMTADAKTFYRMQ